MRHIVSSWLTASGLVVAMAVPVAAAEPPASPKREWNIQIQPGPTGPHPSAASPLVSDGTISRDPIMPGDEMTGSNSLSENLGRGGRFYFGRGNRFLNSANGSNNGTNGNGTGVNGTKGVGGGKTSANPPSLKGKNPPRPIVSKPSHPTNHPRPVHAGGNGSGSHGGSQGLQRGGHSGGGGGHGGGGHAGGGGKH